MKITWPEVPRVYQGVWQRTLYAEPAAAPHRHLDSATQVIWLQTPAWHADLRLPTTRPDFSGVDGLAACSRIQLEWISGLTGFVGLTRVENGLCTWHRLVDITPSLERDCGIMNFLDADTLEERHPHHRYLERWKRRAAGGAVDVVLDNAQRPVWIGIGAHAVSITHRPVTPEAERSFAPIEELDETALRWRAALCLDYLRQDAQGWRVALSTHPWRKGRRLSHPSSTQAHAEELS